MYAGGVDGVVEFWKYMVCTNNDPQTQVALARYDIDEHYHPITVRQMGFVTTRFGAFLSPDLSERFDIKVKEVKVTVDGDGTITAKIVDDATQSLPDTRTGLSLVSDNGNKKVVQFKKKTDLPPGFSLTPSDDPDT